MSMSIGSFLYNGCLVTDIIHEKGGQCSFYCRFPLKSRFLKDLDTKKTGSIEPGCRNNWHIHHAKTGGGQILICTAGSGWYQEEGKAPVSLEPGTVIVIPPEVKHWHGAKADSWFSHIAFEVPGTETSNEWLEEVDDDAYSKLQ